MYVVRGVWDRLGFDAMADEVFFQRVLARLVEPTLKTRLIFHHTREAIEAHLTVVFAALATARHLHTATGQSLKRIITTLKPLREFTGKVSDNTITFDAELPEPAQYILHNLKLEHLAGH